MGRTESLNLKNDYERACGWYGHFNKSEMALFSECTDRYAQKLLDTADIVREAIYRQLMLRQPLTVFVGQRVRVLAPKRQENCQCCEKRRQTKHSLCDMDEFADSWKEGGDRNEHEASEK